MDACLVFFTPSQPQRSNPGKKTKMHYYHKSNSDSLFDVLKRWGKMKLNEQGKQVGRSPCQQMKHTKLY